MGASASGEYPQHTCVKLSEQSKSLCYATVYWICCGVSLVSPRLSFLEPAR